MTARQDFSKGRALMARDLEGMTRTHFDLLIIGGGITGACVAWDAALRGLRVALVDKEDFGSGTSAATSKLIHGGLRYLRQMEFALVRESLHERRVLEVIAPHLVYPIPFLIPTYEGRSGRIPLTLGMIVYELLAYDRAQVEDRAKRIPAHRNLSPEQVLQMESAVSEAGLTGGILYYDCQMYSPERLTLEFLLSAAGAGAQLANYAQAREFLLDDARVCGALVEDRMTGRCLEIRASMVANVTGPWADFLLQTLLDGRAKKPRTVTRSKGIHLITRPLTGRHALVLVTESHRHIFLIPWRGHTLIGTTDTPYEGHPDQLAVTEEEILQLVAEVNHALPSARLTRKDVLAFCAGVRPLVDVEARSETYYASRKYEILDHQEEGISGLFTAIGGKYTTSRSLAKKLVDRIFEALGDVPPACRTEITPLYGGNVGIYASYLHRILEAEGGRFPRPVLENLIRNYGSRHGELLDLVRQKPELGRLLDPEFPEIEAQVVYGVRQEMARGLKDVVLRRTGIGTLKQPGKACLHRVTDIMAEELGWNRVQRAKELESMEGLYRTV